MTILKLAIIKHPKNRYDHTGVTWFQRVRACLDKQTSPPNKKRNIMSCTKCLDWRERNLALITYNDTCSKNITHNSEEPLILHNQQSLTKSDHCASRSCRQRLNLTFSQHLGLNNITNSQFRSSPLRQIPPWIEPSQLPISLFYFFNSSLLFVCVTHKELTMRSTSRSTHTKYPWIVPLHHAQNSLNHAHLNKASNLKALSEYKLE